MTAEAGDHFIEDQGNLTLRSQRPEFVQEFTRLQVGPPTLDRFDQHRGEFVRMAPDQLERLWFP
jgi:hypothetical protein